MVILSACLALLCTFTATAQDVGQEQRQTPGEAKELSGMSIVGNDEAPKSLYIVPWKSSELGDETSLHMPLGGRAAPVDREVFLRQLTYHRVSTERPSNAP
ncbi:MAG: hypothetical protein ACNA8S_04275 [Deferrisomatales bacterium]